MKISIENISQKVKEHTLGEGTGHDWWHVYRVWIMAGRIAKEMSIDRELVELAALLHDMADHKLEHPDKGKALMISWLEEEGFDPIRIDSIVKIACCVSYKGSEVADEELPIEGQIVQDADRLDAIGAVGIARTFAYGGSKHREIYNPNIKPEQHQSFEAYRKSTAPTINHFYEKLLLLKDRLHTAKAKEIAQKRHGFMELYLDRFYKEWEGEL